MFPLVASITHTSPSGEPVAIFDPSGLNATDNDAGPGTQKCEFLDIVIYNILYIKQSFICVGRLNDCFTNDVIKNKNILIKKIEMFF
jgi:hypothetical protein